MKVSPSVLATVLTFPCGHDNLHVFFFAYPVESRILLFCMLLITSSRTSSIVVEKNRNVLFIAISHILRHCGGLFVLAYITYR